MKFHIRKCGSPLDIQYYFVKREYLEKEFDGYILDEVKIYPLELNGLRAYIGPIYDEKSRTWFLQERTRH